MNQKLAWPVQEFFGTTHAMILDEKFREPRHHQLVGANATEEEPRQHPMRPPEDEACRCSAPRGQGRTVERRFAGAHDHHPFAGSKIKTADFARVTDLSHELIASCEYRDT